MEKGFLRTAKWYERQAMKKFLDDIERFEEQNKEFLDELHGEILKGLDSAKESILARVPKGMDRRILKDTLELRGFESVRVNDSTLFLGLCQIQDSAKVRAKEGKAYEEGIIVTRNSLGTYTKEVEI